MKSILSLLLLFLSANAALAGSNQADAVWYETSADGEITIKLWFFWSQRCPHCLRAKPDIEAMADDIPWLKLESRQLVGNPAYQQQYLAMAAYFGEQARSVPAFFFCNAMLVGFDSAATTGNTIREKLLECKSGLEFGKGLPAKTTPDQFNSEADLEASLGIDLSDMSLPLITVIIAGLDAFNPCAFFVLLFLLRLMVNLQSRSRMLLVGGTFVVISGLVYFLFMAAWLNVFIMFGMLSTITLIAGLVATLMAALNIKDYFSDSGASLSMSEDSRSNLMQRMRTLLNAENMTTMLGGTVVLAIIANSYELLCTSGLPMVYTRLLTLEQLPQSMYYAYLAAYNVIYIIPLLIIVLLFVFTLGRRKLQAHEGRLLKLLSGLMMLGLGLMLIFAPEQLSNLVVISGIIVVAISLTLLAAKLR